MTALTAFYDKVLVETPGLPEGPGAAYALEYIRETCIDFFERSRVWRERSVPITLRHVDITAITAADPCVVTAAAHGFSDGDRILLNSINGMTELNGFVYTIGAVTTDTFSLIDISSVGFDAYTSGGDASRAIFVPSIQATDAELCDVLGGRTNSGGFIRARSRQDLNANYGAAWEMELGGPRWVLMHDETRVRIVPAPDQVYRNAIVLEYALKSTNDATTIPDDLYNRYAEIIEHGALARLKAQTGKPWGDADGSKWHEQEYESRLARARARSLRGPGMGPSYADPVSFETGI